MKKMIALVMVFFFLFGCASTTLVKSNPPGAKIQIGGQVIGETPQFYTDKAVAGTVKTVTLKKEGYKDLDSYIKREKFSVPNLIGGIFLLVPFIWILEYPSQYNFKMEKL
jgi:PEGA domain